MHLFGGRQIPPPQKKNVQSPHSQTAAKLFAQHLFFGQDNELQIFHGNFLLTDTKHWKLFVIKQSEGCRCMPKMHQSTFSGRALSGPAGGAYTLHQAPLAIIVACF